MLHFLQPGVSRQCDNSRQLGSKSSLIYVNDTSLAQDIYYIIYLDSYYIIYLDIYYLIYLESYYITQVLLRCWGWRPP